jgi:hypothetical protein
MYISPACSGTSVVNLKQFRRRCNAGREETYLEPYPRVRFSFASAPECRYQNAVAPRAPFFVCCTVKLKCLPIAPAPTTHGRNMAGARGLWRATGMKDSDFGKPIIAVVPEVERARQGLRAAH